MLRFGKIDNGRVYAAVFGLGLALIAEVFVSGAVSANRYTSTNFTIDTSSVGQSTSGGQSSTNYKLTSSSGESVVGNGASGSYKLTQGYSATLEQSLQLTVQPNGLIAFYPFDTNTGTAVFDDSSKSNNTALPTNATWAAGKVGTAVSYDGTIGGTKQISTPSDASLSVADFTVSAWIKVVSLANDVDCCAGIAQRQATVANDRHFNLAVDRSSGAFAGSSAFGGTNRTVTSTGTVNNGAWRHVAYTVSGTTQSVFIDGALDNSVVRSGAVSTTTAPIVIGKDGGFEGSYDEIKFFSRALTTAEIKAEYDAGMAGDVSGLGFGTITPGVSSTASADVITQTDAPSYNLGINQDQNLTNGAYNIPAISGTIASPASWSEGTTKGLGFTLYGTNATALDGKWSSGSAYAALPGSSTGIYSRTGFTAGAKDVLNLRLRLDTTTAQVSGDYTNRMTITGTIVP